MKAKEALEIVEYRNQYCANLYGKDWAIEKPIYEACEKALRFQVENENKILTRVEAYIISKVFQNYFKLGIEEIAEKDETVASLFKKVGLISDDDGDNV